MTSHSRGSISGDFPRAAGREPNNPMDSSTFIGSVLLGSGGGRCPMLKVCHEKIRA
jgi:hypothetical protein